MPTASTIWSSATDSIVREHEGLTTTVLNSVNVTTFGSALLSVTTDGTETGTEKNCIFAVEDGGVSVVIKLEGFSTTAISTTAHGVDRHTTGVTWDGAHLLTAENYADDADDGLRKFDGLTTTIKETLLIADLHPVGITWDGTDCTFVGAWRLSSNGTIRRLWGFSTTTRSEIIDLAYLIPNDDPSDVSFDGTDLLFSGDNPQRIYRLTGYDSSVQAYLDVAVNPDGLEHGVYEERQPQTETEGPFVSGASTDRVIQFLGWASSILHQADVSGIDEDVRDCTVNAGGDLMIIGRTNREAYQLDGLSSTVTASFGLGAGTSFQGCSWDGEDFLGADLSFDRCYMFNGFSASILLALDLAIFETSVRGVAWAGDNLYVTGNGANKVRRLEGFTGTIRETADIHGEGLSVRLGNPLLPKWNFPTADQDSVIETNGVSTTVNRAFDVRHIDAQMTGVEVAHLIERLVASTRLVGACRCPARRRRDPGNRRVRRGSPPFFPTGLDAVLGGWPLHLHQARRARSLRVRDGRDARRTWDRPQLPPSGVGHHYFMGRGRHRILESAQFRLYRRLGSPPSVDHVFATTPTLPHVPPITFADGTWFVAVSYFDGASDSGFLPIGPKGEPYLVLRISGGVDLGVLPIPPIDWSVKALAGGVVRVQGLYLEEGANRATDWAITYTIDGSEPGTAPDVTVPIVGADVAILEHDLPAAPHGTTVKVRLQTKRGSNLSGGIVRTIVADVNGPAAPLAGTAYAGFLGH